MHSTVILSLPVNFISDRHPEQLEVLGVTGTRRFGGATVVTIKVKCGCHRVFAASKVAVEQGIVTCCDACAFTCSDADAAVRAPRPPRCGRRSR